MFLTQPRYQNPLEPGLASRTSNIPSSYITHKKRLDHSNILALEENMETAFNITTKKTVNRCIANTSKPQEFSSFTYWCNLEYFGVL